MTAALERPRGGRPQPDHDAQLAPVRSALLEDARREAKALVTEERARASARTAETRARLDERVRLAREEGHRLAEDDLARRLARAQREARRLVLEERRVAVERVARAALDELRALGPDDARDLRAGMAAVARDQLGAGAEVVDQPDGGVVADHDTRRVDYRLAAVVERAIADLGEEVAQLWT